jgi:hypothetical protein
MSFIMDYSSVIAQGQVKDLHDIAPGGDIGSQQSISSIASPGTSSQKRGRQGLAQGLTDCRNVTATGLEHPAHCLQHELSPRDTIDGEGEERPQDELNLNCIV